MITFACVLLCYGSLDGYKLHDYFISDLCGVYKTGYNHKSVLVFASVFHIQNMDEQKIKFFTVVKLDICNSLRNMKSLH